MKRILVFLSIVSAVMLVSASSALAFGVDDLTVTYFNQDSSPSTQAGSHPFAMTTRIVLATKDNGKEAVQDGAPKNLTFQLPAGLVGDRAAVPRCPDADFLKVISKENISPACPNDTAIGFFVVRAPKEATSIGGEKLPAFNLNPPAGFAAKIGFTLTKVPTFLLVRVNPRPPYNLIASVQNISNAEPVSGSELTIWGNPASPVHDAERGTCLVTPGTCPVNIPERPFLTLPRACTGPLTTEVTATSWEEPASVPVAALSDGALTTTGCEELGFDPTVDAQPTAKSADSPSGLDFDLDVEDPGLTDPTKNADSDIKKAVVTLPAGVTTNSSIASGLGACTLAQYESETLESLPGTGCPENSKIGSVEVETPLLQNEDETTHISTKEVLPGALYVAKQGDNPAHNLLSIYMVIKDPTVGVLIGAVGKVEPDPITGQLTTTFDELPQLPFSHFHLHFRAGPRAPLITPATCGKYTTQATLYPYASGVAPVQQSATFEIDSGAGGKPCATSANQLPNAPGFSAGTLNPLAGAYSPFVLKLAREDGSQQISSISTTLPGGLLGKLAGIAYCSDAQIAQANSRSGEGQGALELASPSCPLTSEVGTVNVGAGAGSEPYYVTGHAYLAGPYKGAPLSLEIITPAIAGPFDLGVVAVRTALRVDLETTQITAMSDPIPTILHGLPLDVRSIALNMGRPRFTLNPTSCEPKSILGSATSIFGSVAPLSQYFQATGCGALGFKPSLALKLKGGTKRHTFPALTATLAYPQGGSYSNIARATVALPHSEFLEQGHIGTVCTNPQFAAGSCPEASNYGEAEAFSPLLDKPLKGPVYLRTPGHKLPDLVADLRGQIEVTLRGRIDTDKSDGIRTTFEAVPDAPVSKFILRMKGGDKGLLVNSENICAKPQKATVKLVAQNGRSTNSRPLITNSCGGKGKKGKASRSKVRR